VSLTAAATDRPPTARGGAGTVHQATLERALGRILAVFLALTVVAFWASSGTLPGQRTGGVAADLLLSVLLAGQAARALRRRPSQRDLVLLAGATGSLLLVSRALAVPGSPFLVDYNPAVVVPVAAAWAVWSEWFAVPVPVLLVVVVWWAWNPARDLAAEQTAVELAIVACTSFAARLLRAGARRADAEADALSRRMAAQDAALAAEEAERRAANAVHDDVLSVLRAVSVADLPLPWHLLVSKARGAQESLARQVPRGGSGAADLGSALRRRALDCAAELDVRCDIDGDIDVPMSAVEALSAAAGEALRNVAVHAGVGRAVVTARRAPSGGVMVTVADDGAGFDPAWVGPASTGLRNSVRARLSDAGGRAEVISAPGQGTSVVLTWDPPPAPAAPVSDPLAWARRMAPSPQLIFAGFMLPILLVGLVLLGLRWQDMRWQVAAVLVFAGFTGLAVLCARYLSQVRMPLPAAVSLTGANAILVGVGSLAVAPGTTDSAAYWVGLASGIVIAAVYFTRGPAPGLIALVLDMAAFTAGLVVTGGALPSLGIRVTILSGPPISAGVAAAMLAAFRNLSSHTESQLAEYRERLRRQARAEAISHVDAAALENARRVAGPVLSAITSSPAPDPAVQMAAALADATLRDELLAPGFLTAALAERVRGARAGGARVTVKIARQGDPELVQAARSLLATALADLSAGDDVTLEVHPPAGGNYGPLILHVHGARTGHAALRRTAYECGALVSDLGDHELLVRFRPAPGRAAVPAASGNLPSPLRGIPPASASCPQ
jgi:signal transduction histidine kinase